MSLLRLAHAGASQHALAEDTTAEVAQKLFQLNTLGPINLTQALLPLLLHPSKHQPDSNPENPAQPIKATRPCHITVVGSMAGKVPSPGQSVYSGCKTALMGYFASLQAELAAR